MKRHTCSHAELDFVGSRVLQQSLKRDGVNRLGFCGKDYRREGPIAVRPMRLWIFDRWVRLACHRYWITAYHGLVAADRSVMAVACRGHSAYFATPYHQIRAEDHTFVVHFRALGGVDATHLHDRVLRHDPQAAVLV